MELKVKSFIKNAEYRKYVALYHKYKYFNRYTPKFLSLNSAFCKKIATPDMASFLSMYKEIFTEEIYKFKSKTQEPYILDIGANIGMSVLYFKKIYPQSKIIAFEPDPKIYQFLKKNMEQNNITDVELIKKAAWNSETTLSFCSEGADGGSINGEVIPGKRNRIINVKTTDIKKYLCRKVDFLKMDIEGSENVVLPACIGYLHNIENIFLEYHSKTNEKQVLHELLDILSKAGFRIYIESVAHKNKPFESKCINNYYDLQLNIFAYRWPLKEQS